MATNNKFAVLDFGFDEVFKELEPLMEVQGVGSILQTFKNFLLNNTTPDARISEI